MKKASPDLIGSSIIGALILTVVAVLISGGGRLLEHKQRAVIYFQDPVTGLSVGSPVTFRGVPIGQVTDIRVQFNPGDLSARIPVYIVIDPSKVSMLGDRNTTVANVPLKKFVDKGMRAQLASQSLVTGQLQVELDFQPDTPAVLAAGDPDADEIPAVRSGVADFVDQLSQLPLKEISDELRETMLSIRVLAENGNTELFDTAGSVRQATDEVTKAVARVQEDASHTLTSVRKLSEHADGAVTTISPQLVQALVKAQKALDEANITLAHTADMTAPGAPIRANLGEALRNLAVASESLRSFSETIDRNPNVLLLGKPR